MNKDYKISNDGTIFEIREDGSISKIAKIDDQGNISDINSSINQKHGNKGNHWIWFLLILLFLATVIFGILYTQVSDDSQYYSNRLSEVEEELSEANEKLSIADEELSKAKEKFSGAEKKHNEAVYRHEYVDLGLSVRWATCNVGADSPEDYGDYFVWGETKTKKRYTEENCETLGEDISDIKGTSRDVSHVKWGSSWRMPTYGEIRELIDNCDWKWTMLNGVSGYRVTGKNGKSIFLPAAGWRNGTSLYDTGKYGRYWSSTPNGSGTRDACGLFFGSGYHAWGWYWYSRYYGFSVRPVSEF